MKNPYFDVYYQAGENPVFCYRTGMAVYEEALIGGAFAAQGWNAAGYPLNVLTNCPTRLDVKEFAEPFAFDLEVNGASVSYGLKFLDFTAERGAEQLHCILSLESRLAPVVIRVHTLLDGTAMFTRWLEIESKADTPLNISRMNPLAGGLETMARAQLADGIPVEKLYSLGYFDDDRPCREGDFSWHDVRPDMISIDTRYNRNRHRHPLVFLRNNLKGTLWFAQIAYSGGCRFTVDLDATRENDVSRIAFKAEITGHKPLIVLAPGEVFATPEVHMGVVQGDLDMAVNEMHDHARRSVLNLPEADPAACYVGSGMGAEHDMSVETSKAFIDQFAQMGAEIFIVDAGWQNPPHKEMEWGAYNGLNYPDPERYPNGLKELSDYCHEKGMKFGMWVEIERIGEKSPVRKEHPDWFLVDIFGDMSNAGFLDFSNPEVAAWAESELARIITEYQLELFRVDYNIDHREYHRVKNGEYTTLRHFEAVGKMYRNLKRRFPEVIFENCAGGGARTDYAQMKAFHHTWVSDWQRTPRSVTITNGMTMALPPERVDRLFAGMGCHEYGSFDLHMRNTMLGHMSLNVIAPAATYPNPVQMAFVQHSVQLYKDFIRPFLPTCKVFHHTPQTWECLQEGRCILEIAAPDGSRGVLGAFTLAGSNDRVLHITCKGADPGKTYRVTLDNSGASFQATGRELTMTGLDLRIPASMASELVTYQAVEA